MTEVGYLLFDILEELVEPAEYIDECLKLRKELINVSCGKPNTMIVSIGKLRNLEG